jgi:hypothetical protein
MTGHKREDEFEAYLRNRLVLHDRDWNPEKLEPPEDLDDIVLTKARRAIHPSPQMPVYRAPRWALPVALAATVLLSLSVVLNVGLKGPQNPPPAAKRPVPEAPDSVQQAPGSGPEAAGSSPSVASDAAPARDALNAPPMAPAPKSPLASPSASPAAPRSATEAPAPPARRANSQIADPVLWLKRIEILRAQGHNTQADAEMRRFRAAFPTFPVSSP